MVSTDHLPCWTQLLGPPGPHLTPAMTIIFFVGIFLTYCKKVQSICHFLAGGRGLRAIRSCSWPVGTVWPQRVNEGSCYRGPGVRIGGLPVSIAVCGSGSWSVPSATLTFPGVLWVPWIWQISVYSFTCNTVNQVSIIFTWKSINEKWKIFLSRKYLFWNLSLSTCLRSSAEKLQKKSESEAAQLCLTLCHSMDGGLPGVLHPWDSPGKNTGVGCHSLLQRIFPTQGSNPGLLNWGQPLHHLSHQGSRRATQVPTNTSSLNGKHVYSLRVLRQTLNSPLLNTMKVSSWQFLSVSLKKALPHMITHGPSWQRFHHLSLVPCGEGGLSVTVERRRGLRDEVCAVTCLSQERHRPIPSPTRLRQERRTWIPSPTRLRQERRTPLPSPTRLPQEGRTPLPCIACCPERVSGSTAGKESS